MSIWIRLFAKARNFRKVDLIVTMTDPPMLAVAGQFLAKQKRTAHIHWCQDVYPDLLPVLGIKLPGFIKEFLRKASLKALKSCDHIIVIGRCMSDHLQCLEFDHKRLSVIPNWPDREFTIEVPKEQVVFPEVEKKPIVSPMPKFRVLYAGNIGRAHPLTTILDAAEILQAGNPEIEFLFVGEGPSHNRLAGERQRRGLDNIRLLPTQPKSMLREMMQNGDIHLISMKAEAGGLLVPSKLYSALGAQRPSVFVGPGNSEVGYVLRDYGAGTVIAQNDAKGLGDVIVKYRMEGPFWFEAHKGARRAAEAFNSAKAIKDWIACARSTIGYPST